MDFIDSEMIFKNKSKQQYFIFDKYGNWEIETANLKDFDFRDLFNEREWIEDQIDAYVEKPL